VDLIRLRRQYLLICQSLAIMCLGLYVPPNTLEEKCDNIQTYYIDTRTHIE